MEYEDMMKPDADMMPFDRMMGGDIESLMRSDFGGLHRMMQEMQGLMFQLGPGLEDMSRGVGQQPGNPRDEFLKPEDQPRNMLLKHEDTDIDGEDAMKMLRSADFNHGTPHVPSWKMSPNVSSGYQSTSIMIRTNPDGSIEETRKYKDHTGREEITTTVRQPDAEGEKGSGNPWF